MAVNGWRRRRRRKTRVPSISDSNINKSAEEEEEEEKEEEEGDVFFCGREEGRAERYRRLREEGGKLGSVSSV